MFYLYFGCRYVQVSIRFVRYSNPLLSASGQAVDDGPAPARISLTQKIHHTDDDRVPGDGVLRPHAQLPLVDACEDERHFRVGRKVGLARALADYDPVALHPGALLDGRAPDVLKVPFDVIQVHDLRLRAEKGNLKLHGYAVCGLCYGRLWWAPVAFQGET